MANKYAGYYLASTVHVRRPAEKGDAADPQGMVLKTVLAGQLLDNLAEKITLTDDELDSLKREGVIRYPTEEERAMVDDAVRRGNHRKALEAAAATARMAQQQQMTEREKVIQEADDAKAKALADLEAKHATEGEGGVNPALAGPPIPDDGQAGTGAASKRANAGRGAGTPGPTPGGR